MSTTISVCMFDNESVRGGAEEHMLCLMRRLDRTRFRVSLACNKTLFELLQPDVPPDVQVLVAAPQSPMQISEVRSLYRFLRHEHIQVLHSHGFRSSLIASPIGRLAGVPATLETPHVREYWRKGWKAHFLIDRQSARFVDRYIAVSEANQRYLINEKRLPKAKVTVIRNGCDVQRFSPLRRAPERLRQSAGFGANDPLLLIAGRLEAQKGHSVLLQAMSQLKHEFPLLRLVALGEGSLRAELETQVRALELTGSVYMPGHCTDIRDWMAVADVCVLPSFAEGLPLFAMECLAAGRPMVATRVDGTPEVVIEGTTGLTVQPGDTEELATAIARLLRDRTFAARLAKAGAARVREWFTIDRQVHETENLYERVWLEKTGRACNLLETRSSEELVQP